MQADLFSQPAPKPIRSAPRPLPHEWKVGTRVQFAYKGKVHHGAVTEKCMGHGDPWIGVVTDDGGSYWVPINKIRLEDPGS